MKQSSAYRCSQCAASFPKWAGQCGACNAWNSLEEYFPEVTISKKTPLSSLPKKSFSTPEHSSFHDSRIPTNIEELDRVLGNGFFPDSLVLLTGDPGIGKSTLSLQVALSVSLQMPKKTVLILTGEESVPQVSSRLFRLSKNIPPNLKILSETVLESALAAMDQEEMGFLVVDSVQTHRIHH